MKKLLLSAGLALVAANTFGQGQVGFLNFSATTITNLVTGLPATVETRVALYLGHMGDPVNTLTQISDVTNCFAPGRFNGGTLTLPGWTGTVQFQVRSWLASTVYPSHEAALAGAVSGDTSVVAGVSQPFNFTLSESPNPVLAIGGNGLTAIVLVPPAALAPPSIRNPIALITGGTAPNGTRTVQLSALVKPGAQQTSVNFQYGLTSSYAATNGPFALNAAFTESSVSTTVSLSPGFIHHWSVVASNALGTTTAPDQTFAVVPTSSGIPGDVNNDGIVSQSEFDAVYARYVTNSPWLSMTNTASTSNVTFALTDPALGGYSVEASTNLLNWLPLGFASPRYTLDDTNAPGPPLRHYRLRYP